MNLNKNIKDYKPNILIVDSNINNDTEYSNIELTLKKILDPKVSGFKEYSIKKLNEVPDQIEIDEIDVLICSGKFKNDLFNRGYINKSKFIIVFCSNLSFHLNDGNILSHPDKIKVENNMINVCKWLYEYFDILKNEIKLKNATYE